MLTSVAYLCLRLFKYFLIIESCAALFFIVEGLLNIRFGVRSRYIKTLLWLFQYGNNRIIQKKRPVVEQFQKPEKTWNAMASKSQVLDEQTDVKPLEAELEDFQATDFKLMNVFPIIRSAIKDLVEDEVTKAFDAEELPYWNLLTRTNKGYQHISWRLTLVWVAGFLFRHFVLFPIRFMVAVFGILFLVGSAAFVARLREGATKVRLARCANLISFRILARALTLHATYHDRQHKPKRDGVCVANHTSPIDVVVLSGDNVYSFVGQQHGGPFGMLQKEIAKAFSHIWFDRAESKDRSLVSQRMQEHVHDSSKPTILIFPEGACVNNTKIMMFKKGSFELDCPVYPVAIRYNPVFGDAFWGHQPTMQAHVWEMITSWAIVCDVWYLPPMSKEPGEDAIGFANRVRLAIAKKGGLVDIDWDPRFYPEEKKASESRWRKEQQKVFSERLVPRKSAPTGEQATVVASTFST